MSRDEPVYTFWEDDGGKVHGGPSVAIIDEENYMPESVDPIPHDPFLGDYQPPAHVDLGMTVHYVARGSLNGKYPIVDRAAIVTEIGVGGSPWKINATVVNPEGLFFNKNLIHNAAGTIPGSWHYVWEGPENGVGNDSRIGFDTGSGGA